MSLWFQPKPRSVVYCDFTGFRMPEMTKRRPVIVLRTHKRHRRLVYVVPKEAWAKCDMVAVVSTERLTLSRQQQCSPRRARDNVIMISEEEFTAIRACVAKAFGFSAGSYIRDALAKESKIEVDEI